MKTENEIGEEMRRSVAVSYIECYLGRTYCKTCGALMTETVHRPAMTVLVS